MISIKHAGDFTTPSLSDPKLDIELELPRAVLTAPGLTGPMP